MRLMMILFLALAAIVQSAMTRDEVCLEQNGWHQANDDFGFRRGFNVWLPYGDNPDEWLCWMNALASERVAYRITIGTVASEYTYRLTCGETNIDFKADTTPTAAEVSAGLLAAWNASEAADCTPITASAYTSTAAFYHHSVPNAKFVITPSVYNAAMAEVTPITGIITKTTENDIAYSISGYTAPCAFTCKVKKGWYMACNQSITNGSAGPVWTPAVDGGGAGIDVTNAAAFSVLTYAQGGTSCGFTGLYAPSETRVMTLKVPAGTTRLYMLGNPREWTGAGFSELEVATDAGILVTPVIDFDIPGSFTASGEQVYSPFSESASATYEGYPHYKSVCLVAADCGGATMTFTPDFDSTNYPIIIGFIAIDDSGSAQPDTGVFDPTTIKYLMPTSFDSSGTQTLYNQVAEGPLYMSLDGGTGFFWGQFHWTEFNTLVSPVASVSYDQTQFCGYTSSTYTPPTEKEWIRHVASAVYVTTSGVISLDDDGSSPADVADAGDYSITYQYTSSGLGIIQKWKFDTAAQTAVAELVGPTFNGGYVAQWSLDNTFSRYQRVPYDRSSQLIGTYDNTFAFQTNVTSCWRYSTSKQVAALFDCAFTYYDASEAISVSKPIMSLLKNTTGDDYNKLYLSPFESETNIPLQTNDEIISYQKRVFVNEEAADSESALLGGSGLL